MTRSQSSRCSPMPNPESKRHLRTLHPVGSVFRKYAPALHRYIAQRVRRPGDAPDLTQEIFERFLQLPQREEVRNPQAYLYSIASHLVIEWHEREERALVACDSEAMQLAADSPENASPDNLAEQVGIEQDLSYALSRLPPMQRAVLLLAKREGMTHEEIARRTGLLASTVTNYVSEACARVKVLLKTRGKEGERP